MSYMPRIVEDIIGDTIVVRVVEPPFRAAVAMVSVGDEFVDLDALGARQVAAHLLQAAEALEGPQPKP